MDREILAEGIIYPCVALWESTEPSRNIKKPREAHGEKLGKLVKSPLVQNRVLHFDLAHSPLGFVKFLHFGWIVTIPKTTLSWFPWLKWLIYLQSCPPQPHSWLRHSLLINHMAWSVPLCSDTHKKGHTHAHTLTQAWSLLWAHAMLLSTCLWSYWFF